MGILLVLALAGLLIGGLLPKWQPAVVVATIGGLLAVGTLIWLEEFPTEDANIGGGLLHFVGLGLLALGAGQVGGVLFHLVVRRLARPS